MAWLVLTVVIALPPAEAQAGCDHPWVKRAGPSSRLDDLAILDAGQARATTEPGVPAVPQRHLPCAGGACSSTPRVPVSSSGPIPNRVQLWGDLPSALGPWIRPSLPFCPDDECRRSTRLLIPIERPPRRLTSD
jgi:hypothetical protein